MKNLYWSPLTLAAVLCLALAPSSSNAQNVTTWRNDIARTGQNLTETRLTPANVHAATFGKLWAYSVDGYVYAQPLYLSGLAIAGAPHNVVFIVTEHDSAYAFDADANVQLWKASVIDAAHGASADAATVPSGDVNSYDLFPEIGITATPVIDPATSTIYIEAKSKENGTYVHRLHALDVATGAERPNSPVVIQASVPGSGSGSTDGVIAFQPQWQNSRPGMLLLNGKVYMAFASHGDNGPYHGWVLGYDAATLQQTGVYNTSPNGTDAGIWQSGAGLAADTLSPGGRMFVANGNGETNEGPPYSDAQNFGNAIERLDLTRGIHVADQWTPFDTDLLTEGDVDQGSGGVLLLPDQPGAYPHELVQVGKNGRIEVLDRDHLGGYDGSTNHIVQEIDGEIGGLWSTPAYWNNNLYFWGTDDVLKQFSLADGLLSATPTAQNSASSLFPGATPIVSANGTANAIVWAIRTDTFWRGGPAELVAFDATNVARLLYSSSQSTPRDTAGGSAKFAVPTVVDGKVFVGTAGEVDVYGLLATAPRTVAPVTFSPTPGVYPAPQTVTLSAQPGASIFYTTDGTSPTAASIPYTAPISVDIEASIQAIAIAPGYDGDSIATGTYTIGSVPSVNYSNGLDLAWSLYRNGYTVDPHDGSLQLTTGGIAQFSSVFTPNLLDIRTFDTTFTFALSGVLPLADGFTFTLQNSSPNALGYSGGALGYGPSPWGDAPGIPHSIAVKFDLWSNEGEGNNSTGLYSNAAMPTLPAIDLTPSGINLSSGHTITAHLVYDGTTLFLTLTDPVAHASFSTTFLIDIPKTIGSTTAYAGFTAGTGGYSATQKILTWAFSSHADLLLAAPLPLPRFSLAPGLYTTPQALTITDEQPGASLVYTTDRTSPTSSSSTPVNGPIALDHTVTLQSLAFLPAYPSSAIAGGTYIFPVATPPSFLAPAQNLFGRPGSGTPVPVTADFNGDGKPDLAIINAADSSVTVMLGNGDGTFQPPVSYFVGRAPASLVAGDFNGDGKPDLALVNTAGILTLLLNDGTGLFPSALASTYAVPAGSSHLAAADFNHDGHLDLAVTNRSKGTVTILLGTAAGTFQTAATYPVGHSPFGTAVADFNHDGYPDLVVWNATDNTVGILLNDTTGKLLPQVTYPVGHDPYSVAVGDFNNDGFPDLAIVNLLDNNISILLNDTSGKFRPQVAFPTGASPSSVLAVDMNGDGVLDLVVANLADSTVGILVGKGDGTFLPQVAVPLGTQPGIVLAADFNADGRPDLAFTGFTPSASARSVGPVARSTHAGGITLLLQSSPPPTH